MSLIHILFLSKIHFLFKINQWPVGKKGMCLAAEGMVGGWADKLLLFALAFSF